MTIESIMNISEPSLPGLPEQLLDIPSLDQLHARKKAGLSLPNIFLFVANGTVEYDILELAEFIMG